jgi:Transposase DDE domain/Insertion element 4 transposase N-terminal
MPFTITQSPSRDKLCKSFSLPILERIYDRKTLEELLTSSHHKPTRMRKLTMIIVIYVLICWSLFVGSTLGAVYGELVSAERYLGEQEPEELPGRGAWVYRRKQVGVQILRRLFVLKCQPLAQPETPGAFAYGLRLMALDGTLDDVTDTPANARYFGRHCKGSTQSPFPQIRCVYLDEVGTHAIVDAMVAPSTTSEQCLAWGLLRSVHPGMLVMTDRHFASACFLRAVVERGAQSLGRLPQNVFLHKQHILKDGSYLVTLLPKDFPGLEKALTLRIIEYTIEEKVAARLEQVTPSRAASHSGSTNPDIGKVHRIATTLLDPDLYPAHDLCVLYHERWEIELAIDEIKDHQRLSRQPLRSKVPLLVLQELYALLLAHYALCALRLQAANTKGLDPDRVSFTESIRVLKSGLNLSPFLAPDSCDRAIKRLHAELVNRHRLLPPRRLRFNCRVVKRICTRFRVKKAEHQQVKLPASTMFADLVVIASPSSSIRGTPGGRLETIETDLCSNIQSLA